MQEELHHNDVNFRVCSFFAPPWHLRFHKCQEPGQQSVRAENKVWPWLVSKRKKNEKKRKRGREEAQLLLQLLPQHALVRASFPVIQHAFQEGPKPHALSLPLRLAMLSPTHPPILSQLSLL